MSKSQRRRVQAQKAKSVKTANPEYVAAMQDLRRSSATSRHKSAADYRRKPKHSKKGWD